MHGRVEVSVQSGHSQAKGVAMDAYENTWWKRRLNLYTLKLKMVQGLGKCIYQGLCSGKYLC